MCKITYSHIYHPICWKEIQVLQDIINTLYNYFTNSFMYIKLTLSCPMFQAIPGYNCPDFTLDTHQAERLMHKIQATKRQRCWCRTVTCLFGLIFLLLSVMAVSMFLTRGQRMFGSL